MIYTRVHNNSTHKGLQWAIHNATLGNDVICKGGPYIQTYSIPAPSAWRWMFIITTTFAISESATVLAPPSDTITFEAE
jgi:hypothetical protein